MHCIFRTSVRLNLLLTGGRVAPRSAEFDTFVVCDHSGRAIGRATMRVDVCPLTKTIAGFELSFDQHLTERSATVAVPKRTRKRKPGPRKVDTWPLLGMPRTVVMNSPEFEAPMFRDAVMRLGETGPDPKG